MAINLSSDLLHTALGDGAPAVVASRELFRTWVEPLADSFTAEGVRTYVAGFAGVVAAALPGHSAQDLVNRYERIRQPRRFQGAPHAVRNVVILSRVTLGADVAVTSIVIDAARQAFPLATLHLAGNAKNAEVFAGEPRLRHLAVPYARTGALRDRLAASASLADAIPSGALVLDPDSRLSQLGLVPVASDDRYFFFESRSAGGDSDSTIGELTAKWCAECFGVQARPWIAPVAGTGGEPRICLSLGTGENPEKGLGGQFEAALVRAAASLGLPVLIDKGMGGEEGERVERAITAVDAPPGQIETWLGPFAPFAFEIARAPLYIGYDSAGQHVAAAAGTPLRCLFAGAPSDRFYQRWKPWGSAANVIVRTGTPPDWRAALAALRLSA